MISFKRQRGSKIQNPKPSVLPSDLAKRLVELEQLCKQFVELEHLRKQVRELEDLAAIAPQRTGRARRDGA
jgi:hypothetical protein